MERNGRTTENRNALRMAPFLVMALTISAPSMLQSLISTLVSTADTVMLGYVSQDAMSASSLANQLPHVMSMAFFGLMAGSSVLSSQYWGKKDTDTIEKVLGLAIRLTLLISLLFFALAFFLPEYVMRYFTDDEAVIALGVRYLKIVSFSYLFNGFSNIYVSVVRSTERVVLPIAVYLISLAVNVTLNAVFIFGLFGAPVLGLTGVAIGTLAARVAEVIVCLVYDAAVSPIKIRLRALLTTGKVLTKDFFKVSLPSVANDVLWSLATTVYSVVIGHMGSDAVAANAVAVMAVNIGAVVCRGFNGGATIIISKPLGAGDRETAKLYSKRMLAIAVIVGVLGCLTIIGIRPLIAGMYADKLTENALSLLNMMFVMRAIQLIGESINTCTICGCFRAGGDAKFGMVTDLVFMWLVTVPLVLLAAYGLKLPLKWVYLTICLDEFYKMPVPTIHYFRFGWLNDITRSRSELEA